MGAQCGSGVSGDHDVVRIRCHGQPADPCQTMHHKPEPSPVAAWRANQQTVTRRGTRAGDGLLFPQIGRPIVLC